MGHSLFPGTKHRRRRDHFGNAARYDDDDCHNDSAPARRLRIPGTVLLGGIVIWSLLALGVWALVDPLLAWAAGMAGPATDLGVGFARWFGLGREATAVRDVANVDGLVGWAIGPVHFLAKGGLVLVWLVGSFTLIALPIVLRRRSR
jgi:hypothetical protein|tara:strand:- start:404 stop:844 length:441 start_codon:yes stop_codon:yes gene_type:complete